jgi:hypothetical protein
MKFSIGIMNWTTRNNLHFLLHNFVENHTILRFTESPLSEQNLKYSTWGNLEI